MREPIMIWFSYSMVLKRVSSASGRVGLLLTVVLAAVLAGPLTGSDRGQADSSLANQRSLCTQPINCGYDPRGATDEWFIHKMRAARPIDRTQKHNLSILAAPGIKMVDDGEIAFAEDDGTMVVPPGRFDLKNTSILFTPDGGDGYSISTSDIGFNRDFGYRLGFFFGVDNGQEDGDNGYREITLLGKQFPFYGILYDTIYIGTNGYITFTQGDTTARISLTSLATELPRIAPLWADLEVVDTGEIYYNRFEDHHLVTWNGAGQPSYGGISTFQAALFDDGRIVFAYRKVKAQSALVGISPGRSDAEPQPVDFSSPPAEKVNGAFFETFGKQKRIDLPALLRAFYRSYPDTFDTAYIWTDFDYDNGLGIAHSFNVRNDISGIGLKLFDRGAVYGSASRLSTIITMGNAADWPSDPQTLAAGLNSAISIVCHEQGHRWLAYVRFDAEHDIKNDLLGRENAHWSFLADTRTNAQGSFSSLMEGNSWRDSGAGTFATIESAVNYFNPLDQYLMGLRSAEEVGEIPYLVTDAQLTQFLRAKSPTSGFSLSAVRKTTSVDQIAQREGPRHPDAGNAQKDFRIAFILLTEQASAPSTATLEKISRYRESLVRYFSLATGGRGRLDASLK